MAEQQQARTTTPESEIKSRPQYGRLEPVESARRNLIAAEGEGIHAVLRMLGEAPEGFAGRCHLVFAEGETSATHELDVVRAFGLDELDVLPDSEEALRYLERLLDGATMGTRLYVVGSESFLGQAVRSAVERYVDHTSIITELSGSLARRVQCVHCKHIVGGITTTHYTCPECGVQLFVRDHYSRRIAAFQGVSANAEDPTEVPEAEEAYR